MIGYEINEHSNGLKDIIIHYCTNTEKFFLFFQNISRPTIYKGIEVGKCTQTPVFFTVNTDLTKCNKKAKKNAKHFEGNFAFNVFSISMSLWT